MRWYYKLPLRMRSLFRKDKAELELDEELRFHLQSQIEECVKQGMNPQEARHAAFRALGGVEQVKEECRDARRINFVDNFLQDGRFGLRMFRRSPGFAVIACVTLALGIGATTSIFSVVKTVIFAPLPFRQPENLVHVWGSDGPPGQHYRRGDQVFFSSARPADLYDWREQNQSFERISAYRKCSMLLTGGKETDLVDGQEVYDDFFEMLGTPAQLGRGLQASDYESGGAHVVVISNRMWVQRLAANPDIIGARISLDRESYQIVGVMPATFYPTPWGYSEFWIPHLANQGERSDRKSWGLIPLARLKPGITWEQAQIQFDVISARLIEDHPDDFLNAVVVPMDAQLIGSSWKLLLLLSGGVTLLLLIALVNVANLLLARVLERQTEFAIRKALGASGARIAYQLFIENLGLSLAAGALGFGFAFVLTKVMLANLPESTGLPRLETVRVDFPLLAFVCGICFVASMTCSLMTLKNSRDRSSLTLQIEGRAFSSGSGKRRLGRAFIVSEFVFSLVLLILGVILVQSFVRLRRVDPGFDPSNLLAFRVQVPAVSYGKFSFGAKDPRRERLYEQLEQIIAAVPGIESVAMSALLPLRHEINPSPVVIPGHEPPLSERSGSTRLDTVIQIQTGIERVNPEYFRALRLKLVSGRFLEERDGPEAPLVAVVNETFVKAFFPSQNPIGKRVSVWYGNPVIVGVVADFKLNGLDRNALPEMFWSLRQDPWTDVWVMARTKSDPALVASAVLKSIRNFDPDMPLRDMNSMADVISESLWLKRIAAVLIGLVAGLAIVLAGIGIYSVVSYSVSQRTKEVGIRVAVGASPSDVLRLILGETWRLAPVWWAALLPMS
ncbi:MAG: ABC transporter permease [Acidobacteria bacterium]|nr:ABC transporter permease [Acidobacteriota bacterium]